MKSSSCSVAGGWGSSSARRDPKLNRVVAIKVLAPELAAHPGARLRFLREARAAAAVNHPHVVTIHAVDEGQASGGRQSPDGSQLHPTLPYLVMECIIGQTLQQKLDKQGSLRLMEILRIGHQTAQGLSAAHKQGLIHRDIKPANVLLENGVERVKITDFGLARAVDDASISRTGDISGTPQYMSPEQASGERVDHRSDLFSLGCVMYAMCTGRSPFRSTTLAGAIKRVCQDTPRPIEEINPECPPWLIEIVNHLLQKNPDDRIQTADEVAQLLGDHLAGVQHPPAKSRKVEQRPLSSGDSALKEPLSGRAARSTAGFSATSYVTGIVLTSLIGVATSFLLTSPAHVDAAQTYAAVIRYSATLAFIAVLTLLFRGISRRDRGQLGPWAMALSSAFGTMWFAFVITTLLRGDVIDSNSVMGRWIWEALVFGLLLWLTFLAFVGIRAAQASEAQVFLDQSLGDKDSTGRWIIWMGALLLLVPLFFWLAATGFAWHPGSVGVDEAAILAAVFCVPVGLLAIALGVIKVLPADSPLATALFLVMCVALGPIGVLLYLYRRDQIAAGTWRLGHRDQDHSLGLAQEPRAHPQQAEVATLPPWLVTPLPGPGMIIGVLTLAIAALLMGQAIEQWSDMSSEVGISLFVAALVLGTLALLSIHTLGVSLSGWPGFVAALGATPLMYGGAQWPDREFKRRLAGEADMVALFTLVLMSISVPLIALLLKKARRARNHDDRRIQTTTRDNLGTLLTWSGIALWIGLAAWMAGVGAGWFPRVPFDQAHDIELPIFGAVMLGGLLFGLGMVLSRRVLTPGLVHQLATESDARRLTAGPAATADAASAPAPRTLWARLLFQIGLALLVLPWLPILFGLVTGNGDPMEFGGMLVWPLSLLGVLAGVGAWVTWLVTTSIDAKHTPVAALSAAQQEWVLTSSARSPWRVLGWMLVAALVIIPLAIGAMLIVPQLARVETGIVMVEFDSLRPVTLINVTGDIGAAHNRQIDRTEIVTSNPYRFPLPPGVYDLTMTFQADGQTGAFTQRTEVIAGRTKTLDVRQQIALSHQLLHLDKRPASPSDSV